MKEPPERVVFLCGYVKFQYQKNSFLLSTSQVFHAKGAEDTQRAPRGSRKVSRSGAVGAAGGGEFHSEKQSRGEAEGLFIAAAGHSDFCHSIQGICSEASSTLPTIHSVFSI